MVASVSSNFKQKKQWLSEWFGGKKYYPFLSYTKPCPWKHATRAVYSILHFKTRDKKPVDNPTLCARTGLDRKTVTAATKQLVTEGYARRSGRGHVALVPDGDAYLGRKQDGTPATYRAYLLTSEARRTNRNRAGQLTEADNAILMALYSLARDDRPEVVRQTIKGLVAVTGYSAPQVRESLARLGGNGLLEFRTGGYTLVPPTEVSVRWWQDRKTEPADEAEPGARPAPKKTKTGTTDLAGVRKRIGQALLKLEGMDQETAGTLVNGTINSHLETMLAGHCSTAEIEDHWLRVIGQHDTDMSLILYVSEWRKDWLSALSQHSQTGLAKSPINLLNSRLFGKR